MGSSSDNLNGDNINNIDGIDGIKIPDVPNLPERKRGELERIVGIIRESAPATEMIILFGSYARGEAVEDVTVVDNTTYEYVSDFDLLVIVGPEGIANQTSTWYRIETKASRLPIQTPVTLIAHDIAYVNRQLEKGQYFFSDIKKEGIVLYDSGNFKLADAKPLLPQERLGRAKANFTEYFESANDFLDIFEYTLKNKKYKKAAFNLHQAAESFYKTVLLVYTNYKPKTHKLDKLGKMASGHDTAFLKIFPMATDEQRRRFDLLKQAYVGARYDSGYKITADDLSYLSDCVKTLRDQTQTSCETKMESF